jgi:hypothetical protein
MHAHEHVLAVADVAAHERDVDLAVDQALVRMDRERPFASAACAFATRRTSLSCASDSG